MGERSSSINLPCFVLKMFERPEDAERLGANLVVRVPGVYNVKFHHI